MGRTENARGGFVPGSMDWDHIYELRGTGSLESENERDGGPGTNGYNCRADSRPSHLVKR